MVNSIDDLFPGLLRTGYQVTSPQDDVYNCIAWAAGATDRWWWPFGDPQRTYWPEGVPRLETPEAFRAAVATLGYAVCDHTEAEPGFEKVALFADAQGCPTHAARQLPGGRWTSKLGKLEDIEHALDGLAGAEYGSVVLVLKRPLAAAEGRTAEGEGG
jgi:hypothetical protein